MNLTQLLCWFLDIAKGNEPSLVRVFQRSVLATASNRIAEVLKELESRQLSAGGVGTVVDLVRLLATLENVLEVEVSLVMAEAGGVRATVPRDVLSSVGDLLRRKGVVGRVQVVTDSPLRIAGDSELLAVVGEGARGAQVSVAVMPDSQLAERVECFSLRAVVGHEEVRIVAEVVKGTPDSVCWTTRFVSSLRKEPTPEPYVAVPERQHTITWIGTLADIPRATALDEEPLRSVADLFGENIVLRDLEPRAKWLLGLSEIRDHLCLARNYVPRKNEPDYALVLESFVRGLVQREDANVIYVGDTLFNDGSAVYNLSKRDGLAVWGFLCREGGFGAHADFLIGNIYFGHRWASLVSFLRTAMMRGLTLGAGTVALFDLDQTVYAAKGRDDEALYKARSQAILAFLGDTVPSYKFNPQVADQVYRTLDQDQYHRLTRDNMDYVVLLVLAVAAGLFDMTELRQLSESPTMSIAALTEELYRRAARRNAHEAVARVLDVVRAVYYNTLAGDQTPCKDFRAYECAFTAQAMRVGSGQLQDSSCIVLNREVCDFVDLLRDSGCSVMAVSDRPVEAAVRDEPPCEDIMHIKMASRGSCIKPQLLDLTLR